MIAQYYVGLRPSLPHCGTEILPISDQQLQLQLRRLVDKSGGVLTVEDTKGIEEIDFDVNKYYTSMDWFVGLDYIDLKGSDFYPDLKKISIGAYSIYSASVLAECKKLESLKLFRVDYIDDLSIFEKLTSLKELYLESSQPFFPDYNFLKNYKSLTSLGLLNRTLNIDVMESLPTMLQVKHLVLDVYSNLEMIYKFPNIETLFVDPVHYYSRNDNAYDLSFLENTPKIVELALPSNNIQNITGLKWTPNLKKLDLKWNTLLTDISSLEFVPKLSELNLSGTSINDVEILSTLIYLEKLDLSYVELSDIDFLSSLSLLEELNIMEYDGSNGYSVLFKLPHLKKVIVAYRLSDIYSSNKEELLNLASSGVIVADSSGKKLEVDLDEK